MAVTRWSVISILSVLLSGQPALSQSLVEQVIAVQQINAQKPVTDSTAIATASEPSAYDFSVPSLWWQQQQQGDAINSRLIDNWHAYNQTAIPHVDVEVNGQIWPLLSYLEQYAFITQFGESAQSYGYQLRVFTEDRLVGLHVCDFSAGAAHEAMENAHNSLITLRCVVELDYFGQGAIRGGRQR